MGKHTVLQHDAIIPRGNTAQVVVRPQVRVRPYRLCVDPRIAPYFTIEDVRVGMRSQFPIAQSVPAARFALGHPLDCEDVDVALDFVLVVTNVAERGNGRSRSEAHALMGAWRDIVGRERNVAPIVGRERNVAPTGDDALPFSATWSCLILPPRSAALRHEDFGAVDPRHEDLGTQIDRVPKIGKPPIGLTPMPRRREHPGFGWDPGYDD